ncbi:hypothetical protein SAMN05192533_10234 [Mesobacillus persicus]|uniref:YqgU-like 6-bladed beta-propeller domain-containing protein n=1 Tax=Mesobacillus persicus TaxID=930146 RepID=A0A1H7X5D8_9BACI|nr:hypothetical protein [Mesobacillus persicus]SEM28319.1 hypothetical protein SAMN05192533_10234 [Mesobacillus persicus]
MKSFLFFAFLAASVLFLGGCTNERHAQPHAGSSYLPIVKDNPFSLGKVAPIEDMEGNFYQTVGWLNDQTILYITNIKEGSEVYSYDLDEGVSSSFYKSEYPIVSAELSPSRKQLLIHAAPSNYEGELTVLGVDGKTRYETKIDSFELAYEWNDENENEVLVSSFKEDWSFATYVVNIEEQNIQQINLPQPFTIWPTNKEVLYLDWKEDSPNLNAPLIKRNLGNGKEERLLSSVHYIDSSKDRVLAIYTKENDSERSTYLIFNKEFEQIYTFDTKHLTTFSGWLVPYYDFIDSKDSMLSFLPHSSGAADMYTGGFALTEISLKDGEEREIFSKLANEPISCSPSGTMCLYGFQLEKVIDLLEKEIINLVNQ